MSNQVLTMVLTYNDPQPPINVSVLIPDSIQSVVQAAYNQVHAQGDITLQSVRLTNDSGDHAMTWDAHGKP